MINVAILLSTYNGEKFVKEQINSILSQSIENWHLFIRDDGSKDSTLEIIDYYVSKYNNIHFIKDNYNKGAAMSFMTLLEQIDAKYYMFCDQDDFWLTNKVELSLKRMESLESVHPQLPLLVHTDLKVVDNNLKEINSSFWKYAKLNQKYLTQFNYLGVCNGITGCTIMINNIAKNTVLPIILDAPMHDYWLALKIAQKGKISYINSATMLYRQHDKNEVGAQNTNYHYFFSRLKTFPQTIKKQLQLYRFLKQLNYGSLLKFYWYKLKYTIIRSI